VLKKLKKFGCQKVKESEFLPSQVCPPFILVVTALVLTYIAELVGNKGLN
jgi:hypothetical protein